MNPSKACLLICTFIAAPYVALASGTHSGGHGDDQAIEKGSGHMNGHMDMMAFGRPAEPGEMRSVAISMHETDDGRMIFEPGELKFEAGESVRLVITNMGETEHEFVMDTPESIQEHKALMEKFPEMEHDDPNAVRLQPGESGEIPWTFGGHGTFEYACLIPGHYEAGMHGPLAVH